MLWQTITVVVYSTVIFVRADTEAERCLTLLKPETMMLECCGGFELLDPEDEECTSKTADSSDHSNADDWTCEVDECIMNKLSLLNPNGTMNEAACVALLEKIAADQPSHKLAVERVTQKCLKGQYLKYGSKHACEANKYFLCGYIHIMLECPDWKGSEECNDVKDLAGSCKNVLDHTFDTITIG